MTSPDRGRDPDRRARSLPDPRPRLLTLARGSFAEALRIGTLLRRETVGGFLLVGAAVVAVMWANSPFADGYFALRDFEVGYEPWHLKLSLGAWAADGLLAVFFFLVGLELKREFIAGDLRDPRRALVPVAAAVGGVIVPALIYALINAGHSESIRGWAIPTATDIAFALAVLAVLGSHLPSPLRIFLLTLAVVDDLIAIVIIAIAYTEQVAMVPLALALIPMGLYALLAHRARRFFSVQPWAPWLILLPIGAIVWALVHASGIHATIAGVVLGFLVPVHGASGGEPSGRPGLAELFEHRYRPLSAGFAVPVFAFFSAGVTVGGLEGIGAAIGSTVTIGIVLGLVVGKPVGIVAAAWLATRLSRSKLDPAFSWIDLVGVGVLAGIGFTVSLLITELSFAPGGAQQDDAKVAILAASVVAALLAAAILRPRNRRYRRIAAEEQIDADRDGVPDVYQVETDSSDR